MTREGRTFLTETLARTAITVAETTWARPPYVDVGGGRHVDHARLPPQRLADAFVLANGRWAVCCDHPSFKGELIDDADLPPVPVPTLAAKHMESRVTDSGIVARPGAEEEQTG
jgi:hypothetical protein